MLPEPYNTWMDRMIRFDANSNDASVYDSGNVVFPHEIMK